MKMGTQYCLNEKADNPNWLQFLYQTLVEQYTVLRKLTDNHCFVWYFFNETLLFCFSHMEVKAMAKIYQKKY